MFEWNLPRSLGKTIVDTDKLVKMVKRLVKKMGAACKDGGCDNKCMMINGIIKGGLLMPCKSLESSPVYHIIGVNYDNSNKYGTVSVPESKINKYLADVCKQYYTFLKWEVPAKIAKLLENNNVATTNKLCAIVLDLAKDVCDYCSDHYSHRKNIVYIVTGIIKGGTNMF